MTPRRLLPIVALAGALALGGCAAGPASAAPEDSAVGADCAQLLTPEQLVILVGRGVTTISPNPLPVVTADSASTCSWRGADRSLTVTAMPAAEVPEDLAERFSLPECAQETGFCGGSITDGDLWIVVNFGWIDGEWEPYVSTALNSVQRSAVAD